MPTPVSFLDALKSRYGTDDVDQYDENAFLVGDVSRRRNKKWELVGMEQTRQAQERYDRLIEVMVKALGINVAVKDEEKVPKGDAKDALAAANMVRLRELDLSGNVDLPLSEIGALLTYFPSLTGLQVSDIPSLLACGRTGQPPVAPLMPSQTLTKLVFNNVGFRSVFQLRALVQAPNLVELHLDNNGLTTFPLFENEVDAQHYLSSLHTEMNPSEGSALSLEDIFAPLRFPRVTTLSLAHNRIETWGAEGEEADPNETHSATTSASVKACVTRGTQCGLGYSLTHAFPAVAKLFLTGNALPNLTLPSGLVEAEVRARVRALQMTSDAASREAIALATQEAIPSHLSYLRALTLLCLNENATLTSPSFVDAVRVLCPFLSTFRITYGNLLPQWNESLSRMYVVASLPSIELLNRGQVRPKERLDSELFYVQRGLAMREVSEETSAAALADPQAPTYALLDCLREKHKETVLSIFKEGSTAGSDGTAHRMLTVKLFFENGYKAQTKGQPAAASPSQSHNMVDRQLPSSLTIGKLKALIKVVFQVDPVNQVLGYRSGDDGVLQVPVELTNESQTLSYYGVSDGAIIVVKDSSLR